MNRHEAAILRTILYADVFRYAMTLDEITRYLITSDAVSRQEIQDCLQASSTLQKLLHCADGYICLARHPDYIAIRQQREQIARKQWQKAVKYGRWLSRIPFVKMVAITGALAMRNPASQDDDFDYILVTQAGRVWSARGFAVLLVRLVRLFGKELCPNYVVAADKLAQSRRDLFIAHEVAQMQPVYGGDLYRLMLRENQWILKYLPNVTPLPTQDKAPGFSKSVLERLLGGWLGDQLEAWEYRRKSRRFERQAKQPNASAAIDQGQVKGHFEDHGYPVLEQYHKRLAEYGLNADNSIITD